MTKKNCNFIVYCSQSFCLRTKDSIYIQADLSLQEYCIKQKIVYQNSSQNTFQKIKLLNL